MSPTNANNTISVSPLTRPRGIVWLGSYPRSGIIWVRFLVSSLVDVMEGKEAASDLEAMNRFGFGDTAIGLYDTALGKPAAEATPQEIIGARPRVLQNLLEQADGLLPVRTHFANVQVFGVPAIDPAVTASGVYVVRNPLDVAVSSAAFRGVSVDETIEAMGRSGQTVETPGRLVYTLTGSWSEHVRSWTSVESPALLVVRYEDLVADTVGAFRRIVAHLKMQAPDEAVEQAVSRSDFARLRALETEKGFSERPPGAERFFRSGRVDQWRTRLTPAQIDRITADHGEQMDRFGYVPDADFD